MQSECLNVSAGSRRGQCKRAIQWFAKGLQRQDLINRGILLSHMLWKMSLCHKCNSAAGRDLEILSWYCGTLCLGDSFQPRVNNLVRGDQFNGKLKVVCCISLSVRPASVCFDLPYVFQTWFSGPEWSLWCLSAETCSEIPKGIEIWRVNRMDLNYYCCYMVSFKYA